MDFFIRFTREKTPQNNFSSQNFSVENNYLLLVPYGGSSLVVYRIRVIAAPGFYFSIWVFGWGLIQKIPQKVDFLSKKWGCIQEKPQKLDFSHYLGLNSRVGLQ